jgi:energy-coupling factor transporter ATP-binding protein EcfA2
MKKVQINLNIGEEDFNKNDYIFSWESFQERPSKIVIYESFEFSKFNELLEKYSYSEESSITQILSDGVENIVNKRIFTKLNENAFLSFTLIDSKNDENFVSDICIFFNKNGNELVQKFIDDLNDVQDDEQEIEDKKNINLYSLSFDSTGFDEKEIEINDIDEKNIDLYYNKTVNKGVSKLLKNFKKEKKGLTIIYGERGVGKTNLIKYISKKTKKKCIFIPCTSFETVIINPEFRNFLSRNTDSIFILDDSDIYFSQIYSKSNIFTNIILQLVDGIDSDLFNVHFISILNVNNIDQIDHNLFECNHLIDVIEVDELNSEKINSLSKHLGKKLKSKNSMKLSKVFRNFNFDDIEPQIGF